MYRDSSNIVKLLVQEPDSALFQDVLTTQALETSVLSLTEFTSALQIKERQGLLTHVQGHMATALCDEKLAAGEIALIPLEDPTYLRAAADRLGIPVFPETLS